MLTGIRAILLGCLAWIVIAALAGLALWPSIPKSSVGWIALLVLGPPLYLLGEALSVWLWSTRPARALSEHPSSGLRIFVGVIIGGAFLVVVMVLSNILSGK